MIKKVIRASLKALFGFKLLRDSVRFLTMFNVIPRALWKRFPVEAEFTTRLQHESAFKYRSSTGDLIGRILFWRGANRFEPETISLFHSFAKTARVILDIGANTGIYSLVACLANNDSQVYSFEPVPRVYSALVENVKLNSWCDRCVINNCAIGDFDGEIELHVPFDDVPTSASMHRNGFGGINGEKIRVQVRRVDTLLEDKHTVDLVKIDVEGFEYKVLQGMMRTLEIHRPTIILEILPGERYEEVKKILDKYSYHYYAIKGKGPIKHSSIEPDPKIIFKNYLCIAREIDFMLLREWHGTNIIN